VLNVFIVVIINCCLTLTSRTFQPMVVLINHLLTDLLTTLRIIGPSDYKTFGLMDY